MGRDYVIERVIIIISIFFLFNLSVQVEEFRGVDEHELTIPPGYYCHYDLNITSLTKLIAEWEVYSGSPVDVYLLTGEQYENWTANPYYYPTEAIYINIGSKNGSISYILKEEGQYYLIFSNIWGYDTTYIRIKEGRIDIIKMISKKIVEFWLYILLLIIPVILGVS
ncbi:MAG: hypothetical protein ACTSRP_13755 [Candidatus Helarchaeota archaeon]